jgi:hypothetical protein
MARPHAPAFSGPQINIPEGSRGGVNESTPMDQRVPERTKEMSDGPNTLELQGGITSYQPAKYEQVRSLEDRHGNPVEHKIIREDR